MKASLVLFLAMVVLVSSDSFAGGKGRVDCSDPYANQATFEACTQGNGGGYNDGQYNNGGYQEPVYNDDYQQGPNYGNEDYQGDYNGGYQDPGYSDNRYFQSYDRNANQQCDPRDPHSFGCAKATFSGSLAGTNPRDPTDFRILNMDLRVLSGDWETVTYVNPTGNVGNEFFMQTNPRSPSQPFGVYNIQTNTRVGAMWIRNGRMEFDNWQGQRLVTSRGQIVDSMTAVFTMQEGPYLHQFTCRDFSRTGKHHFFCAWDVDTPGQGWGFHGYIGFLSRNDWNGFVQNGIRR